jgi:hypothetical protein
MTAQMQQMSLSSSSSGDSGGCGGGGSLFSSGDSRGAAVQQQQQQQEVLQGDDGQQQQDVFSGPIEDQLKHAAERYAHQGLLLHVVTINILTQLQRSLLYVHCYPCTYTPATLVNAVRQLYFEREPLGDAAWEVGPQTGKYWKLLALQRQQQQQQQMRPQQQQQWQWPKQEPDSCADWSLACEGFEGETAKLLQQVEAEERQLQQQGMGQWLWSYDDLQIDI